MENRKCPYWSKTVNYTVEGEFIFLNQFRLNFFKTKARMRNRETTPLNCHYGKALKVGRSFVAGGSMQCMQCAESTR